MYTRGWKTNIQDMIEASQEILAFTEGMDYESFNKDTKTLRAVSLNFIIIGEATNDIPEATQEVHSDIPWHLMRECETG